MRVFNGIGELAGAAGESLGTTDWIVVDQERIDTFAQATGDHQWIHVDPQRAEAGPFGGTIAHGLLTLSLLPAFQRELYRVDGVRMAINYGLDKVRFPAPVPAGSKLRAHSTITEVTPLADAVQLKVSTTMEVAGSDRPACVVESIVRYVA
ncbi:MaoC family dehydratase [Amycolatopsis sp. K13G38]|uniref:MaoC family dehydratase n=1 Tax=Amycolatopsis acididurans TaxID=2724524 RepID=A0ABX1J376_9PSEU|nr:MaoC family dehydratase [Amycolatopsis acididurans]NKQ54208.1 MaoC family dehydratase [Amycolatopsis acididurans]